MNIWEKVYKNLFDKDKYTLLGFSSIIPLKLKLN